MTLAVARVFSRHAVLTFNELGRLVAAAISGAWSSNERFLHEGPTGEMAPDCSEILLVDAITPYCRSAERGLQLT